ncbi:MAG TPA: nitroreductase [Thioalkalivibrio sp.]|nr:nitroreductase [Thioalkalivibrio sp.]
MWDFFRTVRLRHSVRRYQPDMPVEEGKLHAILETAIAAPSAGDLQAYRIIAITHPDLRQQIAVAANQDFIATAPVVLVFCAEPGRSEQKYGQRGHDLFAIQDATIAAAYAQLAVVAAGMASTWVGQFDPTTLRSTLDLDNDLEPIALLCIGYPDELPEPTPRRHMDEIVEKRD